MKLGYRGKQDIEVQYKKGGKNLLKIIKVNEKNKVQETEGGKIELQIWREN